MRTIIYLIFVCLFIPVISYGQGKITRHTHQSQTSNHKTSRNVTISEPDGYINGYGYVDLGLPSGTKWATCNLGARHPEEYGEYFAWGEMKTINNNGYIKPNCITDNKGKSTLISENVIDSIGNLTKEFDVAQSNWKNNWHIPSKEEVEELFDNCKLQRIISNRIFKGTLFIGPNGKSIFIPSAGMGDGDDQGKESYCWCSTVCEPEKGLLEYTSSYYFYVRTDPFNGDFEGINCIGRRFGLSIRPVIK